VDTWSGVSGAWNSTVGWSAGAPPASGDTASINNPFGSNGALGFDASVPPVNLTQLTVDNTLGGSITLTQSGGSITSATSVVGSSASGTLVQSGGTHTAGNLYLGYLTAGSSGTISLSGSASTLSVSGVEVVGYNGIGTLNQSGGVHFVSNTLYLGANDGATGTYTLSGGRGSTGSDLYLGWSGPNASGVLALSGTASLSVRGNEYVGSTGSGNASHGDTASHTVSGSMYLGYNGGSGGSYGLSNSATLSVNGSVYVGYQGSGTFNQTGGTHTAGGLYLAYAAAGSAGTYTLSGDTSVLTVRSDEMLGYNGVASFNQSGGTHTIAGSLSLGINHGASGAYNLTTGSLSVSSLEYLGFQGGRGTFNQSGGSHSIAGTLTTAATVASSGTYTLSGGTLSAGSFLNRGTFSQSGGAFAGALDSYGTFNYGGGTFGGSLKLEPSGVLNLTAPLTAGQGITLVSSSITLGPGLALSANGTGLNNQGGRVTLTGGSIGGTGPLANSGSISGTGSINVGGLSNASGGTISLSGGSTALFTAPSSNDGTIKVSGGVLATFAAAFTNRAAFISANSSITSLTDFTCGSGGYLQSAAGDEYLLSGSFGSSSTQSARWDTHLATLYAQAGGTSSSHVLDVTGIDLGRTLSGYVQNFAWGTLAVDPNQTLVFRDGNATAGGAMYASVVQLLGAPADATLPNFIATELTNADAANPMNVYYDPSQPANAYLQAQTYALGNGGVLAPISVPEPTSLKLLLLAGVGWLVRRPRRRTR
jgi:hypothetical protein